MSGLIGKWNLDTTENFDEYMQALGVSWPLRKVGNMLKPQQEIENEGDKWHINTYSTFKNTKLEFQPGVQFEETTVDGRKVQTTATVEDNKIGMEQVGEPCSSTITRELINPDVMLMTLTAKDVTCKRTYKREKPAE